MTKQYLRIARLVVGDEAGQGLDLSELRIFFKTLQATLQTPNSATIRVYNLSVATARQIQKEFTKVTLQVGYQDGGLGLLFAGTIIQVRRGRESALDSYVDIVAADGDVALNFAIANFAVSLGSTFKDRVEALAKAMKVETGHVADLPSTKLPRGKTVYGMARDHMRDLAFSTDTDWWIQNGQLNVLPTNGFLPGEAVVLTSDTGMVGQPEQMIDGIHVVCLINTRIVPGCRVQIDNKSIQQARLEPSVPVAAAQAFTPSIADDGFYRVVVAEHVGDTRGPEWYSSLICVALGEVSAALVPRGYS